MFQIVKPIFFICETPLHAGAGGGIGTELPIQREAHTNFPKIEASGIKGALREAFERNYKKLGKPKTDPDLVAVFGHPDKGDENAGALGLTDARLLLFPVRSRRGVFAWVTCSRVLKRFVRDLEVSKANGGAVDDLLTAAKAASLLKKGVANNSILEQNGSIWLEEYAIEAPKDPIATALADALRSATFIDDLDSQFAIIPDEYFTDFVQHNTEIHTRIRIGDEGVVKDGALFTEEHLPAESVLYSLVMAHPEFKSGGRNAAAILDIFEKDLPEIVQIGGNATLGKGITRITTNFLKP
jgi:CRISPR-associated protein Cmr4